MIAIFNKKKSDILRATVIKESAWNTSFQIAKSQTPYSTLSAVKCMS